MYRLIIISAFILISTGASRSFVAEDVQNLPQSENRTFLDALKEVLHSHRYPEKYQENVFDCLDSCKFAMQELQEAGYEPKLMARLVKRGDSGESHCWLAVQDREGKYAFIETTMFARDPEIGLGGIVAPGDPQGYDSGIMVEDAEEFFRCWGSN